MALNNSRTYLSTLDDIRDEELSEIRTRRKCVGLAAGEDLREDLVGVCLSGGGLRSACFNLGVLQSFWRSGLIRFVDYLSAVSGGSYIGTYLASSAMQQPKVDMDAQNGQAGKFALKETFPFQEEEGGRQSSRVSRLIYGGYYLSKPWGLANHYLIGAVFNNIALFSLLVAACSLIAILWRSLDFPVARETARLVHLQSDLVTPFLPFFLFFVIWILAWAISYFRRGAEAMGRMAVGLLIATVLSLLIAAAILFGNGDISTPPMLAKIFGIESPSLGPEAWVPVMLAVLTALLPFFHPKRLLQSGTRPQQSWERVVFAVATTAFLVGVPVIVVALLARENVSGFATVPGRALHPEEIRDWEALRWLLERNAGPSSGPSPSPSPQAGRGTEGRGTERGTEGRGTEGRASRFDLRAETLLRTELARFGDNNRQLIDQLKRELVAFESSRPEAKLAGAAPEASAASATAAGARATPDHDGWDVCPLDDWSIRCFTFFGFLTGLDPENPFTTHWNRYWQLASTKDNLARRVDQALLRNRELTRAFGLEYANKGPLDDVLDTISDPLQQRRLMLLRKAALAPDALGNWTYAEVRELNRLQAEQYLPDVFQRQSLVQRRVVIHADQKHRLLWLGGSLAIFFSVGLWIDLNATTVHRFYRDRLARAFVVPRDGREKTIPLSSLKTTARGFPYYLISGTVLMFRRRLFETEQEVNMAVHYGEGQSDPRWTDSFLFSHRYCGSQVTGYLPTAEYERRVQGEENRLDLVDATAISGGALSPLADRNWLITFLMLAFNLRLGQWLPNPRANAPRGRPRFGTIFRSLLQPADQRPYCFVSDGGHCENMGLVQLLRRRCRLIIVSDAGCDPRHEFADLANALRVARIHGGVQLLVFDPDNSYQDVVRMSDLQLIGNKASGGDKDESAGGNVKAHYVLGRIKYPPRKRQFGDSLRNNGAPAEESEGLDGLLIYIKPSLTGDEDLDVLNYRAAHREFPHEPSNDQWFDDKQVEAYRRLGFHIAENMQQLLRPIIRTSLWEDPQWDNKGGNDLREQFEAGWKEARNPFESGLWMPDGRSELWSDVAMRKR